MLLVINDKKIKPHVIRVGTYYGLPVHMDPPYWPLANRHYTNETGVIPAPYNGPKLCGFIRRWIHWRYLKRKFGL